MTGLIIFAVDEQQTTIKNPRNQDVWSLIAGIGLLAGFGFD
jgi:hypothetical protein